MKELNVIVLCETWCSAIGSRIIPYTRSHPIEPRKRIPKLFKFQSWHSKSFQNSIQMTAIESKLIISDKKNVTKIFFLNQVPRGQSKLWELTIGFLKCRMRNNQFDNLQCWQLFIHRIKYFFIVCITFFPPSYIPQRSIHPFVQLLSRTIFQFFFFKFFILI